jgi:hypothetical protein
MLWVQVVLRFVSSYMTTAQSSIWSERVSECITTLLKSHRPIRECKCIALLQGWTQFTMSRNVIALQIHSLFQSEYGTTYITVYSCRNDFFLVFCWILTTSITLKIKIQDFNNMNNANTNFLYNDYLKKVIFSFDHLNLYLYWTGNVRLGKVVPVIN